MPASKLSAPARNPFVYVGIRGKVVALKHASGEIAWSTKLARGSGHVPILVEDDRLYVVSGGEASCLDARNGTILWHNPLKGYGLGFATLGGGPDQSTVAAAVAAAAAAAAAAASAS